MHNMAYSSDNSGLKSTKNRLASFLPDTVSFNGKRYKLGALKGRVNSENKTMLSAVLTPDNVIAIKENCDSNLNYDMEIENTEGKKEKLSMTLHMNDKNNINLVAVKNNNTDKATFFAEFDDSIRMNASAQNAIQLGAKPLTIPTEAIYHGEPVSRHPG